MRHSFANLDYKVCHCWWCSDSARHWWVTPVRIFAIILNLSQSNSTVHKLWVLYPAWFILDADFFNQDEMPVNAAELIWGCCDRTSYDYCFCRLYLLYCLVISSVVSMSCSGYLFDYRPNHIGESVNCFPEACDVLTVLGVYCFRLASKMHRREWRQLEITSRTRSRLSTSTSMVS